MSEGNLQTLAQFLRGCGCGPVSRRDVRWLKNHARRLARALGVVGGRYRQCGKQKQRLWPVPVLQKSLMALEARRAERERGEEVPVV